MHVYEESLGSTCHNKGSIQSVKRGMAVLLITGLPVIIPNVSGGNGRLRNKAVLCPWRASGAAPDRWLGNREVNVQCVLQLVVISSFYYQDFVAYLKLQVAIKNIGE